MGLTTPTGTLLPCPFCGGAAELVEWPEWGPDGRAQISCDNEGCVISCHTECEPDETRDKAIAAWNRRAAGQAHPQGQGAPQAQTYNTVIHSACAICKAGAGERCRLPKNSGVMCERDAHTRDYRTGTAAAPIPPAAEPSDATDYERPHSHVPCKLKGEICQYSWGCENICIGERRVWPGDYPTQTHTAPPHAGQEPDALVTVPMMTHQAHIESMRYAHDRIEADAARIAELLEEYEEIQGHANALREELFAEQLRAEALEAALAQAVARASIVAAWCYSVCQLP